VAIGIEAESRDVILRVLRADRLQMRIDTMFLDLATRPCACSWALQYFRRVLVPYLPARSAASTTPEASLITVAGVKAFSSADE